MPERTVRLEFSGWTPRPVIAVARQMWKIEEQEPQILTDECKAEIQETILRLANDPRMRTVWNWLARIRRDVKVNVEAAWLLWWKAFHEPEPGWTPNEIALAGFFFEACRGAIFSLLFSPAALRWREALRRSVQDLEQATTAQYSASGEQKPRGKKLSPLTVSLPTLGDPQAFLRDPVRTRARMYVIQLRATTKSLYGQPMHSTLATVASVMLDLKGRQQISRDDVRNWVSR
jgi:hypothetical protein